MAEHAAVILAAGGGTRIWPYGELRQKCAIPIAGRPLVQHLVGEVITGGVGTVTVVLGHNAGTVRAALHPWNHKVAYVEQPSPAGTADAPLCALDGADFETALVVYGDCFLTRDDIAAVRRMVQDGEAAAAALIAPLGGERPEDWIGATAEQGVLREVEGIPAAARSALPARSRSGTNTWPTCGTTPGS